MQHDNEAIDYPCSPVWVRHYASSGLTADYPAEWYQHQPEPQRPQLPIPDPMRSLQQYARYHCTDAPTADEARAELHRITPLQYDDPWFATRITWLRARLANQSLMQSLPVPTSSRPAQPAPRGKGIDL